MRIPTIVKMMMLLILLVCGGTECRPSVDRSKNMIRKNTEINREILDNDTDRKVAKVISIVRKNNELLKDNLPDDYEDMYEDYNAPIINIRFRRAMEAVKTKLENSQMEVEEEDEEEEVIDNKTNSLRKLKNRKGKKSNRSLRKSNRRKNRRQRLRNRMKNLS